MHDSLLEDQGHLDDPHLWERVRAARASTSTASRPTAARRAVAERVRARLPLGHQGRAWSTTPTQFVAARAHPGVPGEAQLPFRNASGGLPHKAAARRQADLRAAAASFGRVLNRND